MYNNFDNVSCAAQYSLELNKQREKEYREQENHKYTKWGFYVATVSIIATVVQLFK